MCKIPVIIFKEEDGYIAYSPALDLTTCGDSFEEAKSFFAEAVELFLEEVVEMGTLENVLEECGWKKVVVSKRGKKKSETEWIPPTVVSKYDTEISLPC